MLTIDSYLMVDNITDIAPLDAQAGVFPAKCVPDRLYDPLFGQDDTGSLHTYAIVDAAKLSGGFGEIESCDEQCQCLFQGDAADTLQDVAPYLVELASDGALTRRLMTYDPALDETLTSAHLWHLDACVFVRTTASFDDVRKHFRKFTHVQADIGKWFYFRFWEAQHIGAYFAALQKDLAQAQRWFLIDGKTPLTVIVPDSDDQAMRVIGPNAQMPMGRPTQPFRIGALERDILKQSKKARFLRKLTKFLRGESAFLAAMDRSEQVDLVQKLIDHAFYFGIRIEQAVADFALASLIFGRPLDGDPVMAHYLNARHHQSDKARNVLNEARKRPASIAEGPEA